MIKFLNYQPNWENRQWRILPYSVLGVVLFALTSASHLNSFLSIYLVLLEAKLGIIVIYFLISKLRSKKK